MKITMLLKISLITMSYSVLGEEVKIVCPDPLPDVPEVKRSEVYEGVPFKAGEEAKYRLKYGAFKVHVGYGFLRVEKPTKHQIAIKKAADGSFVFEKRYHRVFAAEAYTGEWYKWVFKGHDKLRGLSRPWDFGISQFWLHEDHEKPFSSTSKKDKYLDFDHHLCKVKELEVNHKDGKESNREFDLAYGALDVLGALYKLRTLSYEVGKRYRVPVYTSEKNWFLEAVAEKMETIKENDVKAGTFETVKLKLQTYIGRELQQKGDLYMWLATSHPGRPMVKIEGEVSFGSIYLYLESFQPGS